MSQLYHEENKQIDQNSLELVYIFIKNCGIFKNQGFCLYPPYDMTEGAYNSESNTFIVKLIHKKNFIDLFEEEKVNIKILCGENGAGKTTLLRIIEGKNGLVKDSGNLIEIYKDKNGNFASTEKTIIYSDSGLIALDSDIPYAQVVLTNSCVTHRNMQIESWAFEYNIFNHFAQYPELYDGITGDKLFTNFRFKLRPEFSAEELFNGGRNNYYSRSLDRNDFLNYFISKNDYLLLYFLTILQDSTYDNFLYRAEENRVQDAVFDNIVEYLQAALENSNHYDIVLKKFNSLVGKNYRIEELHKIYDGLHKLQDDVVDLFDEAINGDTGNHPFIEPLLDEFFYTSGFSYIEKNERHLGNLSSGEIQALRYRYEIYHPLSQQKDGIIWFVDEPEQSLHPEWCRNFINEYMKAYMACKKFIKNYADSCKDDEEPFYFNPGKRFTILFATHSPFLLSDVTNDYVIYLEKDKETGFSREVRIDKSPFAGNIGEMFCSNFFMKNTIGEFARKKIEEMVAKLNNYENEENTVQPSIQEMEDYQNLISAVGDDLLRQLLSDKLKITTEKYLISLK